MPKSRVRASRDDEAAASVPRNVAILYQGRVYSFKRDHTRDIWRCTVSGTAFRGFHSLMSHFDEVLFATERVPGIGGGYLGAVYIPWIGLPFGGRQREFYRDMTCASDTALDVLGDRILTPDRASITLADVDACIGSGADLVAARRARAAAREAQDPQEAEAAVAADVSTVTPPQGEDGTESDGDSRAETMQ